MSKEWKEIQQNHIKYDPFYKLLVDQNGTFDDNKDVTFINELLKKGRDMIYKKYGKTIQKNTHISQIFNVLLSDRYKGHDYMIKLFALLTMINYEQELANSVEKFYNINGGIFEEKGPQMFRKTMILVKNNINQTFKFPYNISNICEIINNFMYSVHMEYTCG